MGRATYPIWTIGKVVLIDTFATVDARPAVMQCVTPDVSLARVVAISYYGVWPFLILHRPFLTYSSLICARNYAMDRRHDDVTSNAEAFGVATIAISPAWAKSVTPDGSYAWVAMGRFLQCLYVVLALHFIRPGTYLLYGSAE